MARVADRRAVHEDLGQKTSSIGREDSGQETERLREMTYVRDPEHVDLLALLHVLTTHKRDGEGGVSESESDGLRETHFLEERVAARVVARAHLLGVVAWEALGDDCGPREALVVFALEALGRTRGARECEAVRTHAYNKRTSARRTAKYSICSATSGNKSIAQLIHLCPMHSTSPMLQTNWPDSSSDVPAAGTGLLRDTQRARERERESSSARPTDEQTHRKSIVSRNLQTQRRRLA